MIEAQPITADDPPVTDRAAEHLKVLTRLREIGMERLEALAERVQLAREDGKDEVLIQLNDAADKAERSVRQTLLLDIHITKDRDVRVKQRGEHRQRLDARKAEIAEKLVDVIDRPERGRERVERLYVEMDAWLASHDESLILTRPIPELIDALAADLGLTIDWVLTRAHSWSDPVLTIKPAQRTGPPLSARSRRALAKPP
jgi:hypothetical protein